MMQRQFDIFIIDSLWFKASVYFYNAPLKIYYGLGIQSNNNYLIVYIL